MLVSVTYLLLGVVSSIERFSEANKIESGNFTDTFEPMLFTRAITWPSEKLVADPWPGYPATFSASRYQGLVDESWRQLVVAGFVQSLALAMGTVIIVRAALKHGRQGVT